MSRYGPVDYALHYGSMGWQVFPIAPRTKDHPLVPWGAEATSDPDQIRKWWAKDPGANIGIACGNRSGLVVLDVDPRHGGDESLLAMVAEHGPLPDTVESITGGGGRHIIFKHPGVKIKNSANNLGPGLDIRGDGGMVVAPPSIHPNGGRYEWEVSSRPSTKPLADMPGWLIELTQDFSFVQINQTHAPASPVGDVITEGSRNQMLASLAGSMRRRGMSTEAITAALLEENMTKCVPPLPADDVQKIAQSISRYNPATPFRLAPQPVDPNGQPTARKPLTAIDVSMAFLDLLDNLSGRTIPTHIPEIDNQIGGLERQTLTVLAARPSMGKSTLAWQIAQTTSLSKSLAYVFSLEMSAISLWAKSACANANTSWLDVRAERASQSDIDRVVDEAVRLMHLHEGTLLVDDGVNTSETIWQSVEQYRPDLVVVDHLRLVADRSDSEVQRLGAITKQLKDMAKAFNCAVLCLAQLNRGVEIREDKRPQLSDLRDSGQVEENADLVLMMYRDDYYDKSSRFGTSTTELLIRKYRDGVKDGRIMLPFNLKSQWFGRMNEA
jgi:KaiC/GvpD/RAD55 family RecA-like ATPase